MQAIFTFIDDSSNTVAESQPFSTDDCHANTVTQCLSTVTAFAATVTGVNNTQQPLAIPLPLKWCGVIDSYINYVRGNKERERIFELSSFHPVAGLRLLTYIGHLNYHRSTNDTFIGVQHELDRFVFIGQPDADTNIDSSQGVSSITTVEQLAKSFELADFLDDKDYFNALVQRLFDCWSEWSSHLLHDDDSLLNVNLRHQLSLLCPYQLLPDSCIADTSFMKEWRRLTKDHIVRVNRHIWFFINATTYSVHPTGDHKVQKVQFNYGQILSDNEAAHCNTTKQLDRDKMAVLNPIIVNIYYEKTDAQLFSQVSFDVKADDNSILQLDCSGSNIRVETATVLSSTELSTKLLRGFLLNEYSAHDPDDSNDDDDMSGIQDYDFDDDDDGSQDSLSNSSSIGTVIMQYKLQAEKIWRHVELNTKAAKLLGDELQANGHWICYHLSGRLHFSGYFQHGKMSGKWQSFYDSTSTATANNTVSADSVDSVDSVGSVGSVGRQQQQLQYEFEFSDTINDGGSDRRKGSWSYYLSSGVRKLLWQYGPDDVITVQTSNCLGQPAWSGSLRGHQLHSQQTVWWNYGVESYSKPEDNIAIVVNNSKSNDDDSDNSSTAPIRNHGDRNDNEVVISNYQRLVCYYNSGLLDGDVKVWSRDGSTCYLSRYNSGSRIWQSESREQNQLDNTSKELVSPNYSKTGCIVM